MKGLWSLVFFHIVVWLSMLSVYGSMVVGFYICCSRLIMWFYGQTVGIIIIGHCMGLLGKSLFSKDLTFCEDF